MQLNIAILFLTFVSLCTNCVQAENESITTHSNSRLRSGKLSIEERTDIRVKTAALGTSEVEYPYTSVRNIICDDEEEYFINGRNEECRCKANFIRGIYGCLECLCPPNSSCTVKMEGMNEKTICVCNDGYYLANDICEAEVCRSNPCQNGGNCSIGEDIENFTCSCVNNFTGKNCEIVTACDKNPCKNGGSCEADTSGEKTYYCSCKTGYTGENCTTVTACESNLCMNGGSCSADTTGEKPFNCACRTGFTGDNCDTVTACKSNPCKNGGSCTADTIGEKTYTCSCRTGYTGDNCDTVKGCENFECKNGGECELSSKDEPVCKCKDGFNGTHCEKDFQTCKKDTCKNGGTCMNILNDYVCNCPELFTGKDCSDVKWCKEIGKALCGNKCELDSELNMGFCKCEKEEYFDYESKTCKKIDICPLMQCEDKLQKCENSKCVCKNHTFENGTCDSKKLCPGSCPGSSCIDDPDDPEAFRCLCGKDEYFDHEDNKCKPAACVPSFSKCQQKCTGEGECSCHEGFQKNDNTGRCDIDPDVTTICTLNCGEGTCVNISSTARCACPFGYEGEQNCSDQCILGTLMKGICPKDRCEFRGRDFKCICDGKYRYDYNGKTCIKRHPCVKWDVSFFICEAKNAKCVVKDSAPEGYTCECPKGYEEEYGECIEKCKIKKYWIRCSRKHMKCFLDENFKPSCKCPSLLKYSTDRRSCSILEKSVFKVELPIKKDNYVKKYSSSSQINYVQLEMDIRNAIESVFHEQNLTKAMDILNYIEDGDVVKCSLALAVPEHKKLLMPILSAKSTCVQKGNGSDFCVIHPNLVLKTSGYTFTPKEVDYCDEAIQSELCGSHSVCSNSRDGEFECTCKPGFTERGMVHVEGSNSVITKCKDIHECLHDPCPKPNECLNLIGSYGCECPNAYKIPHENSDLKTTSCIEVCKPNPCKNGVCSPRGKNRYSCKCSVGHSGINCDIDDSILKTIDTGVMNAAIVGAVLGTALLIAIIAAAVKIRSLKRKAKYSYDFGMHSTEPKMQETHLMQGRIPRVGEAGMSQGVRRDRQQDERRLPRNDRSRRQPERDEEYYSLPENNKPYNGRSRRDNIDDDIDERERRESRGRRNRGFERD